MGIKTGGGRCHEINGDRFAGVVRLGRTDVVLHAIDEFLVCRTKVGSTRIRCVITISRRRWSGMKIRWTGKALPDDSGTNGLAVLLDQLTIGLLRKEKLCETGHYERIHKAEQYGGCDCHQHGCN